MKSRALILFILLFSVVSVGANPIITIEETVTVSKAEYSLKDLISAEVPWELAQELESIHLAKIPQNGQSHYYSREYLQYLLKQKEIALTNFAIPARVKVSPLLKHISSEEMIKDISSLLTSIRPNLHVSFSRQPAELYVPQGHLEIDFDRNKKLVVPGNNSIPLLTYIDGQLWKRMNIQVYLDEQVEVVRLVRALEAGEILTQYDFTRDYYLKGSVPSDHISPGELHGELLARRNLEQGTILSWYHLERKPVIDRGEQVTIILSISGIEISALGEALEKGSKGDKIRVRNLVTGQILHCYIEGKGTVILAVN